MPARYPAVNEFIQINLPRAQGSQKALADAVGVSEATVSRWVAAESSPHSNHWEAIAAYFDVTPGEIEALAEQSLRMAQLRLAVTQAQMDRDPSPARELAHRQAQARVEELQAEADRDAAMDRSGADERPVMTLPGWPDELVAQLEWADDHLTPTDRRWIVESVVALARHRQADNLAWLNGRSPAPSSKRSRLFDLSDEAGGAQAEPEADGGIRAAASGEDPGGRKTGRRVNRPSPEPEPEGP